MFSLSQQQTSINSFTPRMEKHGNENVLAGTLKCETTMHNSVLDLFDKGFKKLLYRKPAPGEQTELPLTAEQTNSIRETLARFGHHPDPATDFCVEVESLLGEIENCGIGFENGTPTQAELATRIERAMLFRVGGDPHAVMAKQQLRDATTAEPVAQVEDATTKLLRDVRAIYIGTVRPQGDGCDAETWDRIEAALSAQPRAVPDGWMRALERALPFLDDEASKYEDDGNNEPLDVADTIRDLLAAAPSQGEAS